MAIKRLGSSKGMVMVLLTAAAVCGGLVYFVVRERGVNTELVGTVTALRGEQTKLEEVKGRLEQVLKDRETELEAANTTNYRADMVRMQDAFKSANQQLNKMIRERAELENSNYILNSRLSRTTKELTRSLGELTQVRTLLSGTENPHKVRMTQLSGNLKRKEQEASALRKRLEEMERSLVAHRAQGQDYTQGAQRYQERMEILSRNVANLRTELTGQNRQLLQKDAEIDNLHRDVLQARTVAEQEGAAKAAEKLELQRQGLAQQTAVLQGQLKGREGELDDLRKQIAEVRDRLYDREASLVEIEARRKSLEQQISASQEHVRGKGQQLDVFQREVESLREKLREREMLLSRAEDEAQEARRDAKDLEKEITALRTDKKTFSRGTSELAKVRRTLDKKIRELERENAALEKELALAEKRPAVRGRKGDPFRDRNLRLMTEQLVKKEEEIQGLTRQLAALTKEKRSWEKSFGPREKHMAELEILVNTLTKQLGDYAGMIEERDADLRAGAKRVASLSEDLEAQKMAALALQKELAEARARQERTLRKLTQLMSMNTDGVGPDDMDFDLYGPASGFATRREKAEDPKKARHRVDKLKRQVEVMMEQR